MRVQELCESRGGRPGLSVLSSLMVSVDVNNIEPCFGIGLSLSLICQPTSADIKQHFVIIRKGSWQKRVKVATSLDRSCELVLKFSVADHSTQDKSAQGTTLTKGRQ